MIYAVYHIGMDTDTVEVEEDERNNWYPVSRALQTQLKIVEKHARYNYFTIEKHAWTIKIYVEKHANILII